jgi:hypothetical protein
MAKIQLASFIVAAGAILVTSTSTFAQNGRYTMTPTKDGVLKLDTKTGAVSLCNRSSGNWACNSVDDNEGDLKDRIRRLEKENMRLRARLEDRQLAPAPNEDGKLEIPSEADVDKAMDFMERLLHRFKGMVEDLKKNKDEEDGVPL